MARVEKVMCLRCAQTTVGGCGGVRVLTQRGRVAERQRRPKLSRR